MFLALKEGSGVPGDVCVGGSSGVPEHKVALLGVATSVTTEFNIYDRTVDSNRSRQHNFWTCPSSGATQAASTHLTERISLHDSQLNQLRSRLTALPPLADLSQSPSGTGSCFGERHCRPTLPSLSEPNWRLSRIELGKFRTWLSCTWLKAQAQPPLGFTYPFSSTPSVLHLPWCQHRASSPLVSWYSPARHHRDIAESLISNHFRCSTGTQVWHWGPPLLDAALMVLAGSQRTSTLPSSVSNASI